MTFFLNFGTLLAHSINNCNINLKMYPLAEFKLLTADELQKQDSSWDLTLVIGGLLLGVVVFFTTLGTMDLYGITFYIFFFFFLVFKMMPSEVMHRSKISLFENEYNEIIDSLKKKNSISVIKKKLNPEYFDEDDISSLKQQMEDAEVHSKVFTSKKKTMTMKQISTKLTGLKKNEKIFFRSQSKWSKGDPLTNQTANDYGHLYVSNLSVMFSGYNRSTRINFTRIVEIEKYEDLISIKKTAGNNDNFSLSPESAEYFILFYKNRKKVK